MDKQLQLNLKFIGTIENELKKDDVINIDDKVNIVVKDIKQSGLGFGSNQVIIEYLFNVFFVGVPSGLIATLIYDKLLKGKNKLVDESRKIVIITKEELANYLELLKKESSEKK